MINKTERIFNYMKKIVIKTIYLLILLLFHGIMNTVLGQQVWPIEKWSISSPEEQKLNSSLLFELVDKIEKGDDYPNLHSLLIVRNGYLIIEKYFNGYHAERLQWLQSATKSFTSALIGIAIGQGKIKSIDEKILSFFTDISDIQNLDSRKKSIKLQDILTMRSGTDYHQRGSNSPHFQRLKSDLSWDHFYLNRPMVNDPGNRFQYDSGGIDLLASILKKTTGVSAEQFAKKHLFTPLGIKRIRWDKNKDGNTKTAGGLFLLPRDMAKFGLLYLRSGKWGNEQIIPEWWIEESVKTHVRFFGDRPGRDIGYGYLWWILEPYSDGTGEHSIYSARGALGQYLFIIPDYHIVIVVTGGMENIDNFLKPIEFLYSTILPSVLMDKK